MDNFMDRLAQRLNAQEMIRANVAAETAELEQLRDQVEAYDASLRKMQIMSDTNAENVVKMEAILDGYSSRLTDYSSKLDGYGNELAGYAEKLKEYQDVLMDQGDENYVTKEELQASFDNMKSDIQTTQDHIEDFSHKENVKVYRNVQAAVNDELQKKADIIMNQVAERTDAVLEELEKQTQSIQKKQDELSRQIEGLQEVMGLVKENTDQNSGNKKLFTFQIITLLAVLANIAALLLGLFGKI